MDDPPLAQGTALQAHVKAELAALMTRARALTPTS